MRLRAVIVLAAVLTVVAGCGGDDGEKTAPTLTEATSAGGSATGAITSARCTEIAAAMAKAAAAVPQTLGGTAVDYRQSVDQLEAFATAAPSEIRDDLKIVVEGYANVARVFSDANYDPASGQPPSPEVLQKLQQTSVGLSETRFTAAADRVNAWFQNKCGR